MATTETVEREQYFPKVNLTGPRGSTMVREMELQCLFYKLIVLYVICCCSPVLTYTRPSLNDEYSGANKRIHLGVCG